MSELLFSRLGGWERFVQGAPGSPVRALDPSSHLAPATPQLTLGIGGEASAAEPSVHGAEAKLGAGCAPPPLPKAGEYTSQRSVARSPISFFGT